MNIFSSLGNPFRRKPLVPTGNNSGNISSVINQSRPQMQSRSTPRPAPVPTPMQSKQNAYSNQMSSKSPTNTKTNYGNSPMMSPTPRMSKPGMTSPYIAPKTKYAAQTQTTVQQQPNDENLSYFDRMKNSYDESQKRREQLAEQNRQSNEQSAREMYDNAIASAKNEIPSIEQGLSRYQEAARQGISNEEKNAQSMKSNEENDWGKNQKLLAQAKRQTSGERERQYSALGTIDSYGSGSFTESNQKDDQSFLDQTNSNLQQKQSRVSQIDFALSKAKQDVESKILDKVAETQSKIREINSSVSGNENMKAQALRQAYLQFQQEVTGIKDEYEGLRMNSESQKMNYMQELKNSQGESQYMNSLSQEFLTTGKPKSMNDIMYITKNPQAAKTLMETFKNGSAGAGGKASAKDSNIARQGVSEVDSVFNNVGARRDLNPLSNRQYKTSITNITDLIGRMRSGGAITMDEEKRFRTLLPTYWDNDETSKAKLNKLRTEFSGLGSNPASNSDSNINNNDPLGLGF